MTISKLLSVFIISLIALFFSFSCCSAASDSYAINFIVPNMTIDSYWNNQTGESLSLSVVPGSSVEFGVTTSIIADNISWYNGSTFLENDTATSQGNLTHIFDSEGIFKINVSAYNGSDWTGNTTFTVSVLGSVNLSGYVINRIALPVENARIDINNNNHVYTDSVGYYKISNITSGTYDITVKAIAYGNKYDTLNLTNSSVSNYTLMERTSPSTVPGFGIIISLIILSFAVFWIRRGKTILKH